MALGGRSRRARVVAAVSGGPIRWRCAVCWPRRCRRLGLPLVGVAHLHHGLRGADGRRGPSVLPAPGAPLGVPMRRGACGRRRPRARDAAVGGGGGPSTPGLGVLRARAHASRRHVRGDGPHEGRPGRDGAVAAGARRRAARRSAGIRPAARHARSGRCCRSRAPSCVTTWRRAASLCARTRATPDLAVPRNRVRHQVLRLARWPTSRPARGRAGARGGPVAGRGGPLCCDRARGRRRGRRPRRAYGRVARDGDGIWRHSRWLWPVALRRRVVQDVAALRLSGRAHHAGGRSTRCCGAGRAGRSRHGRGGLGPAGPADGR